MEDEQALHRLVSGIRGQIPGPGPGQAALAGECPYRGLRYFDVAHAPFFFGRQALTEWLLNALRSSNRFLAIIGPSGSGKSSLARAGLIAAIKRGELPGSEDWPLAIFRPGADPSESLVVALADAAGLSHSPTAVDELHPGHARQRAIAASDDATGSAQCTTGGAFCVACGSVRRGLHSVSQPEQATSILRQLIVRRNSRGRANASGGGDALRFCLSGAIYPRLGAALSDRQVLVGPMTDDELRQAIEQPALLAGCEFEIGLVDRLFQDIQGQPGSLPLLEHASWNYGTNAMDAD